MGLIAALALGAAASTAGVTDHGWVCHLVRPPVNELASILLPTGEMEKFRLNGDRLEDMDAVGIGMDMSWRVIVNNEFGLVAASASATPDTFDKWPSGKPKAHVEVSTIAIDKATMKITETISAPSDSSADQIARGECKAY